MYCRQTMSTCKTWLCLSRDCKPGLENVFHFLYALLFKLQWHWHTPIMFTIVNSFVHFHTHCFSLYPSHISLRIYLACSLTSGSLPRLSVSFHIQTDLVSQASSHYGSICRAVAVWGILLGQHLSVMPLVVKSSRNEGVCLFGELFHFSPHK